jgi:sodium transport system permease protein
LARLSDINIVFQKEVLYILRDTRTLMLMALIPIVFMPLFLLGPQMMAQKTIDDVESTRGVVLLSPDNAFLRKSLSACNFSFSKNVDDPMQALRQGKVDAWLEPPADFDQARQRLESRNKQPIINVRFDGRQLNSFLVESKVVNRLFLTRDSIRKERLKSLGIPEQEDLLKVSWQTVPLNKRYEAVGFVAMSVPPILVLMILLALMYPSLDLITGERERGTMSLLIVACINHADIMIGKMAAVAVVGQTSILLALISLYFSVNAYVAHGYFKLGTLSPISPVAFFGMLIMAVPLVILYTGLAFLLAGMCKKFQQGQGYFLPFLAVAMFPAGICSMQGVQMDSPVTFLPVCGALLGMRDLLTGNFQPLWLFIAWLIGMAYAVAVFLYASRLLDREAAMNEGTTPALVRRRKGDYRPEAALLLAVCFLLMFYGGQVAQAQDALTGVLLSQLLCIAGPAIACMVWLQQPIAKTLSLVRPRLLYVVAALLLSPAVAMLSLAIGAVQSTFLPIPESYAKAFLNLVIQPGRPLWLVIAVFALLPAICEELLFRGALQGLLRKRLSPKVLILTIGLAFGLFHMSTFRFLPTATMGIVLSALTLLSGSIFPSMLLHGLHNTILILIEYKKMDGLSSPQIIAGLISAAIGIALIVRAQSVGSKSPVP